MLELRTGKLLICSRERAGRWTARLPGSELVSRGLQLANGLDFLHFDDLRNSCRLERRLGAAMTRGCCRWEVVSFVAPSRA